MSEEENRPTVDLVVGEILKYGCFEDSSELAMWTEDEIELFAHSLEQEGVSPEDVDEIISYFDAIATMYAVAAELWYVEGESLSESEYWKKTLEVLAKYSSLTELWEKLAYECPYSDTYDTDSDYPPGTTALMCTIGPEKNQCPEGPETCCAQCPREMLCPKMCSQFEGLVTRNE